MNETQPVLTNAEWEIMRVVWTKEKTTSKEVSDTLNEEMNWKSATTKTFLGRLVKKGYLSTTKQGKVFIYSPLKNEEECLRKESEELFSKVCKTKKGTLLNQWIEETEISQRDLNKLEKMIQDKKRTAPERIECDCLEGQCACCTHK